VTRTGNDELIHLLVGFDEGIDHPHVLGERDDFILGSVDQQQAPFELVGKVEI